MPPRSPVLRLVAGAGRGPCWCSPSASWSGRRARPGERPASAPRGARRGRRADRERSAAEPVDPAALRRAAVEGMLDTLDDRWSAYYDPSAFGDFQQALGGRYSGVGLWLQRDGLGDDAPLRVTQVLPGSRRRGGRGPHVGDQRRRGRRQDRSSGEPVGQVVPALRGGAGSAVSVRVVGTGGAARPCRCAARTSRRATSIASAPAAGVPRPARAPRSPAASRPGRRPRSTRCRPRRGAGAGPARQPGRPARRGGGDCPRCSSTAGPWSPIARRSTGAETLDATPGGDTRTPLVVLVDGGTASAAEVVAGALQDRGRAVVVGIRTFGKGSVQEPMRLGDGSAMELTVGTYRTPSGRSLDGVGLVPDVDVASGQRPGDRRDPRAGGAGGAARRRRRQGR